MNECEKKESASSLNVAAVGSILSFVGTLLGRGLSFVIRVVITRIFGAKYFGLLAIGIMVSEMARIVGSVGLPKGGMRFTSLSIGEKKLEKLPPILGTSALVPLCLSVALSGAILLLADKISVGWFHNREVSQVIKLMCIGIPFAAVLRVCSDISKGFSTTVYSVIVESVFMPLSTIVLFLLFFLLKLGFMSIVYSLICSYILSAILMITFLIRQMLQVMEPVGSFSSLLKSSIDLQVGKEILVYSFPLFLSGFTIIVLNSVDIVMLGRFMQLDAVGIYAAAATFPAFLSLLIIMSVNSIFAPLVATHYGKKDIATIGLLYKATTRWVFYITLPLVGAIVILRKEIMAIFGRDFVAVGSVVLCLLMIGQMINCVTGGVGYLLAMTGHQKKELGINVMVIVLNVILNVVLIPIYGVIGAAIATAASHCIVNVLRLLVVRFLFGFQPLTGKLWRYSAVCGIVVLLSFWATSYDFGRVSMWVFGMVAMIIMLGSIFAIGLEEEDVNLVRRLPVVGRLFIL